jgi:hypothetical protein
MYFFCELKIGEERKRTEGQQDSSEGGRCDDVMVTFCDNIYGNIPNMKIGY